MLNVPKISYYANKKSYCIIILIATPIGTAGASGRFYDITCKYYGHVVGVLARNSSYDSVTCISSSDEGLLFGIIRGWAECWCTKEIISFVGVSV